MAKKKVLWIGDGYAPTGFATVNHNIISNLPEDKYDIHHIAINYYGDPHDYKHKMYPASLGGDLYGYKRLADFAKLRPDIIFMLNDLWIIDTYLDIIKQSYDPIPKIVVYYPVDSEELDISYFKNFDIVTKAVVYSEFGYRESKKSLPDFDFTIIPHGLNRSQFYKINMPKQTLRNTIFTEDSLLDPETFIVLNANRNQPRKKIDITIDAFRMFCENKPKTVKLYLHMGMNDAGWDILKLVKRYGIADRLIITSTNPNIQTATVERLNLIYNVCDVGVNTSTGEGWGLVNTEHAATGAPQIVPDHSACTEIFQDIGILVKPVYSFLMEKTNTRHKAVSAEDVAKALETIYTNKELYQKLSKASTDFFNQDKFDWKYIGKQWDRLFDEI